MLDSSIADFQSVSARLRGGRPCYSLGIRTSRSIDFIRMAAGAGYHTIWIDLEHSTIPLDTATQMASTARDLDLEAWVRVPEGDFGVIGRLLDGGVHGLIVPQIETAEDARKAVSYCRYPPEGGRSQNALIAPFGFRRIPPAERVAASNRDVVLQVLLESREAIENVEDIAAVEGVDIIGLGLNDLSANLDLLGQVRAPEITAICRRVIAAAARHGKLAVIGGVANPDHYRELVQMGAAPYVFAAIDTDLFVEALDRRIATWQDVIQG